MGLIGLTESPKKNTGQRKGKNCQHPAFAHVTPYLRSRDAQPSLTWRSAFAHVTLCLRSRDTCISRATGYLPTLQILYRQQNQSVRGSLTKPPALHQNLRWKTPGNCYCHMTLCRLSHLLWSQHSCNHVTSWEVHVPQHTWGMVHRDTLDAYSHLSATKYSVHQSAWTGSQS